VKAIQPRNPRVSCQRRRSKYIGGSVPKIEHSRGGRNRRKNLYHEHHQNSFEHSIICACRVTPTSASRRSSSRASALRWRARERHAAISSRAAGRAVGLSQPTIGRRLAAFEATFGGPTLFERLPEGLRLNAAGDALMPVAEELESAALALERRRAAASPALSGTVRVSVGEWGGGFLARHLGQSGETGLPPTLTLELVESWETANLARRD